MQRASMKPASRRRFSNIDRRATRTSGDSRHGGLDVYISALHFAGLPRQFLLEAERGRLALAISAPILDEVLEILRVKFHWAEDRINEAQSLLAGCTRLVRPSAVLDAVPNDPDDNRVLECAVEAGSQYIVTGDSDLLSLHRYANIQILKVADFLAMLDSATA